MLFTIIKNFLDKYAPRRIIWTHPEKGHSFMRIELLSSNAFLRVTSSQKDEKTETISVEMIEKEGEKPRLMWLADVRSTGLLLEVWEGMMKHKLELRKKYCYGSKLKEGGLVIEQHSIDACFMPDESEVEDEWI